MKIKNLKIKKKVYNLLLCSSIFLLTTGFNNKNSDKYNDDFDYGYVEENTDLKKWPVGDNFNYTLGNVEKYQKFEIISSIGSWYEILYDGEYGYLRKKDVDGLSDKFIEIDLGSQKLDFYVGRNVMLSSDIVSGQVGSKDTETRIGCFNIYKFEKDTYLVGKDYRQHVNYWMPFDGSIGMHDALWRSKFGGDIYLTNGSHGCINLPLNIAKDVYDNSNLDTKVLVHK